MKNIFAGLFMLAAIPSLAQVEEKTSQTGDKFPQAAEIKKDKALFDVTVSLKNQHYWRGGPVGFSPVVTSQISLKALKGLEVGSWNGFGLDGVFKDVDTYVSYSNAGFTVALWDVYNFTSPTSGYADPATFPAGYFDYDKNTTRHFLDLSVSYDFKKIPLNLFAATIVYGRDRSMDPVKDLISGKYAGSRSGENRYSTYTKAAYTIKTKKADFTPYMSYGFVFNNVDNTSFWGRKASGITEIGANVSKSIKVTDSWNIAVSGGIVASPMNNTVNGLVGITLF